MRVYVFGTRGFPNIQGGVEKHCENLYTNMSKDKQITVFRRKSYLSSPVNKHYKNISFIDLPSTKIKGVEAFLHSFLCAIWCLFSRPDIVHIHNIGPGIFTPLLRIFGLKTVVTYHSPNYEHKKWNRFGRFILKCGELFATSTANSLIFINKSLLATFPEKTQRKASLIPNGVDKQSITSNTEYLDSLNLEKHKFILAVGRITQEKGFDYLIDAFTKSSSSSNYTLVIAGGIDHSSEYSKQLFSKAEINKVLFVGFVEGENLRQLYSSAALFVLPSFNEGFPLVLVEAINYKRPILASDISANMQIGLPSKNYFPVGDVNSLVEKLDYSLSKAFEEQDYAIDFYSWADIAQQVEEVYKQTLRK